MSRSLSSVFKDAAPGGEAHNFIMSQGVGVPNGEDAPSTTRDLAVSAYGFAPWAGTQNALGMFPKTNEPGYEPSLAENIRGGHWGDAALQTVGMVPEVGPLAKMLGGAVKAASGAVKAAGGAKSLPAILYGVSSSEAASQKALDMLDQGASHNRIWDETKRVVSPDYRQVLAETDDSQFRLSDAALNDLFSSGKAQGTVRDMIVHPEATSAIPGFADVGVDLNLSPKVKPEAFYSPSRNGVVVKGNTWNRPGDWSPYDMHMKDSLLHELNHAAAYGTGVSPAPGKGPDFFRKTPNEAKGLLSWYLEAARRGDPRGYDIVAATPLHDTTLKFIQKQLPSAKGLKTWKDIMDRHMASISPEESNFWNRSYGFDPVLFKSAEPFDQYYKNFNETLSRLAEMRSGMSAQERAAESPFTTLSRTDRQPAWTSLVEMPPSVK